MSLRGKRYFSALLTMHREASKKAIILSLLRETEGENVIVFVGTAKGTILLIELAIMMELVFLPLACD